MWPTYFFWTCCLERTRISSSCLSPRQTHEGGPPEPGGGVLREGVLGVKCCPRNESRKGCDRLITPKPFSSRRGEFSLRGAEPCEFQPEAPPPQVNSYKNKHDVLCGSRYSQPCGFCTALSLHPGSEFPQPSAAGVTTTSTSQERKLRPKKGVCHPGSTWQNRLSDPGPLVALSRPSHAVKKNMGLEMEGEGYFQGLGVQGGIVRQASEPGQAQ